MDSDKPDSNDKDADPVNTELNTDDSNHEESAPMDQDTTFEHVNTESEDMEDVNSGNSKDPFELTQDEKKIEEAITADDNPLSNEADTTKDIEEISDSNSDANKEVEEVDLPDEEEKVTDATSDENKAEADLISNMVDPIFVGNKESASEDVSLDATDTNREKVDLPSKDTNREEVDLSSEDISIDANKESDEVNKSTRTSSIDEESSEVVELELELEEVDGDEKVINVQNSESKQACYVCCKTVVVKYNFVKDKKKRYLCNDPCLRKYQEDNPDAEAMEPFRKFYLAPLVSPIFKFLRVCKQCASSMTVPDGVVCWEAMDFCKESCLYRYQIGISRSCAQCGNPVAYSQMGKYAVRFGCIVRQFCSGACLELKKKKIRICSYCQKSIRRTKTTLGNKYFCDEACKGKYEHLQMPNRPPYLSDKDTKCYVCKVEKVIRIEFSYHNASFYFCTPQCFTVFKFVQNSESPKKCHTCSKYVFQQYLEKHALYYDNIIHYFCSDTCQHIYVITNRRVVPCLWCKVKKYNFDMIQKNNYMENTVYTCSILCLNQFKASVRTALVSRKKCHFCGENGKYDLQIGGGILAAFCSNYCISAFQTKRVQTPVKRTRGRIKQVIPDKPSPLPIISNVCSLASAGNTMISTDASIKKIIIIKEAEWPEQKNVSTSVEVMKCDQSSEITIESVSMEAQTDIPENEINIIPVPVPIYIPAPFPVWSVPTPQPIPFPLCIPCPILIPLTKNASEKVLKEILKEEVKAPDDPFEAELLMMAELVAAEKKDEPEEPKSEEDTSQAEEDFTPEEAPDSNHAFGDDMLQMALKMATDYEEPPVDLEGALRASTITPSQREQAARGTPATAQNAPKSTPRGRKKTRQGTGRRGRGRPPLSSHSTRPEPEPEPVPQEPVEKPDANMCLKYTFGVNAWKQWVTLKNTDLERSSRRLKLFKPELLQLTADELNYSLCLFVNEVRKPNGSEYAPDTIYYLCLGIQQYLYENGRIDNIFCDTYYDKFTDCLNEVCQKFSALYNDSHYIVTRVEEEHLWESKQLGAHSPQVLLTTLMFFNTKHFNLTNVEEHMQLSFSHIMKHWKRASTPGTPKIPGSRNVLLRFYPPQSTLDGNARKKKVYEQQENEENPLRCPVKLYEFYLLKCPESVKTRNDVFYLQPERSCVPDSPVWYSTMALESADLEKTLHRVKMVKEINVALLTN